ncbi:unnamed protein product [Alopecurus aequalis]
MEPADLTQQLPEDMLVAVLRRLPPHGLAAARCVCKAWHAVIDALRLLDLYPSSLAGIFINYHELDISEFFFRPPRDGTAAVSGKLHHYVPTTWEEDTIVQDHCNGLLLFWTYVANPATRRWAPLPRLPPDVKAHVHSRYILFDPAVSPHYEVLLVPRLLWGATAFEELHLEWPPSSFMMHVFSSTTGIWEERSFARQGDAIGTVAHVQQLVKPYMMTNHHSAYWDERLYVLHLFVTRISLSNCTYQAIEPPVDVGTSDREYCLGRSEDGVYFASIDDHQCRLRVWILNELHSEMEWVLKHDNKLGGMLSRGMYDQEFRGPWMMEDINYSLYDFPPPIDTAEDAEGNTTFEWNSDNENTLDTRLTVRKPNGISILGFHPYKEIVFLNECVNRGLAYHLNSSKIEDLGNIYPYHYTSMGSFIEESFPYTPCWIGKLPGSI